MAEAITQVRLNTGYFAGEVDRRMFSGFVEHLGRCVYEGIYDPASKLSDGEGWRRDVIEKLRPLAMPLMRYPGGNFVSCYDWWDGVGPRNQRPRRLDFAWRSIETNEIGIDEFVRWCRLLGSQPMLAVNLGTRGAAEAQAIVEYCNLPTGTKYADQRAANGSREPYGIKVWCLGNEMDGPWQAGHVPAEEYARRADQAAKMMKGTDRGIELVLCGSSGRGMPTYLEYDRVALEYCWEHVDYVSAHRYSSNRKEDSAWFLAEGVEIDRIIEDYRSLFGYVRGRRRSEKKVHLSFDEWNVWYKAMQMDGKWTTAPHLIEEVYNLEDAIVCGQYLTSFVRNADVVKIACIAQMVNVIAPLLTRRDGLLVQSTYYPLEWFCRWASGLSLRALVSGPTCKAGERGEVPAVDVACTWNQAAGELTVFAVNRDIGPGGHEVGGHEVVVRAEDLRLTGVTHAVQLTGTDLKAANSWEHPDRVIPTTPPARIEDGALRLTLSHPAVACVRLTATKR